MKQPDVLIVGAGIIGLEMATVYSSLGTRIDVVEMLDGLMQGADRDLVRVWQKMNTPRFDNIMLKTKTVGAEATPKGLWYPTILGVLVVVAGVGLFCGSIYVLLGTNLGARLGFLVAAASNAASSSSSLSISATIGVNNPAVPGLSTQVEVTPVLPPGRTVSKVTWATKRADCVFADPPFNIGYEYDVYDDRQSRAARPVPP